MSKPTLQELIRSTGENQAAFARSLGMTSQTLNNWLVRGIPGSRLFDVADLLGVPAEDIRHLVADAKKKALSPEQEIAHFRLIFGQLQPEQQLEVLHALRRIALDSQAP